MLHLKWEEKTIALRGDGVVGVAAKLRLDDRHAKAGVLGPVKYLEGVARTFDLLPVEEFIAFYRRAVDARILHPDFRFSVMVADLRDEVVLTIHVTRDLMERRLISFAEAEAAPFGVSVALERDSFRWAGKQEALA